MDLDVEQRVLVVSDTHLAPGTPSAESNWAAVVREAAAWRPEVVIHAGDLTLDGISEPEHLLAARFHLDQLPMRRLAVPGNHDIGDTPGSPVLDLERLQLWRRNLGPDYWTVPVGGWTLLGVNAQLLGSNLVEEKEQWAWMEEQVAAHALDRPIALILHKPLFASDAELASAPNYRFVPSPARDRLLRLLDTTWCPPVISGHVHQYRILGDRQRQHVWAPTSWAVLPDRAQAVLGLKSSGVLAVELRADGAIRAELVEPPGLAQLTLGDDIADPYEHSP